jgi:hypothetical protein
MNLSKIKNTVLVGQSVIVINGGQEMPATVINFNNWTENASRTVAVELGTGEIFDCKISQIKAKKQGWFDVSY